MGARAILGCALALAAGVATAAVGLGEFSATARSELEGRIRAALKGGDATREVSGTVTFAEGDVFFIQAGDDALKVVGAAILPKAGETVRVAGRPELEGGRVILAATRWSRTGKSALPAARPARADDLTFAGEGASRGVNWLRVEVSGRAIGRTSTGFALDLDGLPVTVFAADAPAFIADCTKTRPKTIVRGVAELILDQSALFGRGRYVIGVKICVSSVEDIILVPDPVYLVNCRDRRVMLLVTALIVILLAVLVTLLVLALRQRRRHAQTQAVLAERRRMADDLHDTIEQHLAGAGMLLKLARLPANKMGEAAERPVREAQDVLLRAKQEMRDIVWGLKNDDMMNLSPAEMLRKVAMRETKKGLFRVRTRLTGLPEKMEPGRMRDLSLIVRESIGNAVKHGAARHIAITADLLPDNGRWLIRIANDGAPFDPAKAPGPAEGHFGVEGMKERARRVGASLGFSRKGKWTIVTLEENP